MRLWPWRKAAVQRTRLLAMTLDTDGLQLASISRDGDGKPVVDVCRTLTLPTAPLPSPAELGSALRDEGAAVCQRLLLLPATSYRLQVAELPDLPVAEQKEALRWRLAELFNLQGDSSQEFDPDSMTFDLLPLPGSNRDQRSNQGVVAAIDNASLKTRQQLFDDAELPLDVIDIAETAQRNLSALAEPDGRGLAVLSLDARGGLLTVTHGGELYLLRRIDTPLSSLQQADEYRLADLVERLALDIQRSLDMFDRQHAALGLSKLLLAPTPGVPTLLEHMARNLYLPVAAFELGAILDYSCVPELAQPEEQSRYWSVLGAALRLDSPGG